MEIRTKEERYSGTYTIHVVSEVKNRKLAYQNRSANEIDLWGSEFFKAVQVPPVEISAFRNI